MKPILSIALALACCLAATSRLHAQAPQTGDAAGSSQTKPPADPQKSVPNAPKQASPDSGSNPFPEDTNSVPVMPNTASPGAAVPDADADESSSIRLPSEDADPVRSPDDPAGDSATGATGDSSSSLQGLGNLLPAPDADTPGKKTPTHEEGAVEDVNVGGYYLERKNWKAALSRFESALVLDPENPDVYWGLAEAEQHLGDYAAAKANYLKLLDYDPDGKHGKEARKALKEPELANAPAAPANPAATQHQQQ
jgi:tetratricopeptide (TPR) repeat protein